MDILFIWYGKLEPIYGWRDTCIRRALELYPEANFKCITTLKEFYGMELIDANALCEEMEAEGYYSDMENFMVLSDEMRFWWLARNKNTLYMDTDTFCIKPFEPCPLPRKSGIEALWNGEDLEPFAEILTKRIKGNFFVHIEPELEIESMNDFFEHKPRWAKDFRKNDMTFVPTRNVKNMIVCGQSETELKGVYLEKELWAEILQVMLNHPMTFFKGQKVISSIKGAL